MGGASNVCLYISSDIYLLCDLRHVITIDPQPSCSGTELKQATVLNAQIKSEHSKRPTSQIAHGVLTPGQREPKTEGD